MNRRSFLQAIGAGLVLAGVKLGGLSPGASLVRVGEDLYFHGARGGLYVKRPGASAPERLS